MANALRINIETGVEELVEIDDPVPVVPNSITNKQARIVLSRRPYAEGKTLLEAADEAIAAMPGQEGVEARIQWERSDVFRYDHPLINTMCVILDISEPLKAEMFDEGPTVD